MHDCINTNHLVCFVIEHQILKFYREKSFKQRRYYILYHAFLHLSKYRENMLRIFSPLTTFQIASYATVLYSLIKIYVKVPLNYTVIQFQLWWSISTISHNPGRFIGIE